VFAEYLLDGFRGLCQSDGLAAVDTRDRLSCVP